MNRVLEMFNLPKLIQEEIETINNPITSTEIEAVIKKKTTRTKKTHQKTTAQDHMAS